MFVITLPGGSHLIFLRSSPSDLWFSNSGGFSASPTDSRVIRCNSGWICETGAILAVLPSIMSVRHHDSIRSWVGFLYAFDPDGLIQSVRRPLRTLFVILIPPPLWLTLTVGDRIPLRFSTFHENGCDSGVVRGVTRGSCFFLGFRRVRIMIFFSPGP